MMFSFFHLYGLILGFAISIGYWQVERLIKKEKIQIKIDQLAIITIISGIVGARIYHLLTDWHLYVEQPWWSIFAIWNGGVGVLGALLGGGVGLWLGLKFQHKEGKIFSIVDILALSVPLAQAIGRWGNYVNHELFGLPTTLPWGIFIPLESRPLSVTQFTHFHPLFLYESILSLGIFFFLQQKYTRGQWSIGSKKFIGAYFMLYSGVRFCLEFLRVESARGGGVFFMLSTAQWMTVLLFSIGLFLSVNNSWIKNVK